jgi:hypothetical protein
LEWESPITTASVPARMRVIGRTQVCLEGL